MKFIIFILLFCSCSKQNNSQIENIINTDLKIYDKKEIVYNIEVFNGFDDFIKSKCSFEFKYCKEIYYKEYSSFIDKKILFIEFKNLYLNEEQFKKNNVAYDKDIQSKYVGKKGTILENQYYINNYNSLKNQKFYFSINKKVCKSMIESKIKTITVANKIIAFRDEIELKENSIKLAEQIGINIKNKKIFIKKYSDSQKHYDFNNHIKFLCENTIGECDRIKTNKLLPIIDKKFWFISFCDEKDDISESEFVLYIEESTGKILLMETFL